MSFGIYAIQFYVQSSLPLLRRFLLVSLCYITIRKRAARRAGDGGAGGAIAFYAEMPAAEISAAGIFDSFPFFALAHRRFSITKLVSATPCRSTCCSRMTRYPLFSKKGFAVIDAWVLITPAHTCSSLSQRAVATPLP